MINSESQKPCGCVRLDQVKHIHQKPKQAERKPRMPLLRAAGPQNLSKGETGAGMGGQKEEELGSLPTPCH